LIEEAILWGGNENSVGSARFAIYNYRPSAKLHEADVTNLHIYRNPFGPSGVVTTGRPILLREQKAQLQTKTLTGCKPVSVMKLMKLTSEYRKQWLAQSRARTARAGE
jgi:hypothetical protein